MRRSLAVTCFNDRPRCAPTTIGRRSRSARCSTSSPSKIAADVGNLSAGRADDGTVHRHRPRILLCFCRSLVPVSIPMGTNEVGHPSFRGGQKSASIGVSEVEPPGCSSRLPPWPRSTVGWLDLWDGFECCGTDRRRDRRFPGGLASHFPADGDRRCHVDTSRRHSRSQCGSPVRQRVDRTASE